MLHSIRYGDELSARSYPLEVAGPMTWQRDGKHHVAVLDVPPCPSDHIVVPSLATTTGARHQFMLSAGDRRWPLPAVPADAHSGAEITASAARDAPPHVQADLDGAAAAPADPRVPARTDDAFSPHIDCWHTHGEGTTARLVAYIESRDPPPRYLLTATIRPLTIDDVALPGCRPMCPPPAPISQLAAPASIANRICSPTALAMVLGAQANDALWRRIVARCHDPLTGMYGVWPYAIRAAALEGRLGAVEVLADWTAATRALAAGVMPVASIRFSAGELPGAPLADTGGHLVVVYGLEDDTVLAADPAAADAGSVLRRYPLEAFARAWFAYRGAAYIVPA